LRWFTEPCGLTAAQVMQVTSPFDYAKQAALYVPEHLPKPGDPGHAGHVAQLVVEAVQLLGGRTLVLTTTLNAMRSIGEHLQSRLDASQVEVLVQGQSPKRRLMERFREGAGEGRPGCVLVASASFWEGFDVPGDALQLVVIDKLPFPPPGDPLFEARSQRITREGRSAFADHALPEAAVALKQGAGRLIRSETDQGVLVVCDARLTSMSYGRRLIRGLPEMRRLTDHAEFIETLRQLTKDATIREIHHRVKNNLQTVASLLRIQSRRAESDETKDSLEQAMRRVSAIALVHDTLSEGLNQEVSFDEVFERVILLVGEVAASHNTTVRTLTDGRFGQLKSEKATPLAVALTEIVTNAIEHGLNERSGNVLVHAERKQKKLIITVSDNGKGIPGGKIEPGLGTQIIRTLIEGELRGTINWFSPREGGARVVIEIPL
jgi:two-component sensor histidine kinase